MNELWPHVQAAAGNDPVPLLVCADHCDENGQPMLAYALRWCAAHGRRPHFRTDVSRNQWQWIREQNRYTGLLSLRKVQQRRPAVLAHLLFTANRRNDAQISFDTSYNAYQWLASALRSLRQVVEMPAIVLPPAAEIVRLGPVTCRQCGIMRERERLDCPVCGSRDTK